MQQRRVRLGDILDDYCPRERRITNHAVVAMIEDQVKQTRCTTCDADHEFKGAKVPAQRRRKAEGVLVSADEGRPELVAADASNADESTLDADALEPAEAIELTDAPPDAAEGPAAAALLESVDPTPLEVPILAADAEVDEPATAEDEWPVHRPLIRATLPRPEGHVPERKEPDFTMRSGRFDGQNRNGQRHHRGARPQRQAQGQFGNPRFGGGPGGGQPGERNGNRAPQAGQRGGGRPGGQGPRHGGGPNRGPKRGR